MSIAMAGKSAVAINWYHAKPAERWTILTNNLQEKVREWVFKKAVPQTDTGGLVEKTKAIERKKFKELGKKTTRNFGRWVSSIYWGGT